LASTVQYLKRSLLLVVMPRPTSAANLTMRTINSVPLPSA